MTTVLGLAEIGIFKTSWDELAIARVSKLVAGSMVRDGNGGVRIEPTAELRAETQRVPGMKFAAFDAKDKAPLPGSSLELTVALKNIVGVSPSHTHILLPGDPGVTPLGFMEPKATPFGLVHIAVYRQKFRWDDLFHSIEADFEWLAVYLVAAIIGSAATAWFAVRRGLAPLHKLVGDVARIDMDTLDRRLAPAGVPAEIEPLVGAMNDALDRLAVGAARQRRFAANAAHELRTPVAILIARLDAPEEVGFRADLKRDARRIQNIVEQLLAASRLSERRFEFDEDVDLVALGRVAAADAALVAVRNNRQISFEAPDGPIVARANRTALKSVIVNLIDNAVRAEPEGGAVVVRIGADRIVEVIDHGEGVAACDREMIFEPFWRKTDVKPGAGLGLAIAKELMDMHDGRIWVEETPGGGATFRISLPGPSTVTGK